MRKTILALVVCVLSLSSSAQVSGQVAADASRYLRVLPSGSATGPAFRVSSGTTDAAAKTAHPDEKARWQVVEDRPSGNVLIIRGAQATQGELTRAPSRGPAGAGSGVTDNGMTERLPRQVPAATVNRAVSTIPEFELSEPMESSAPAELRGTAMQIRRIAADHPRDNAAAVQAAGETLVLGPVAAAGREQLPATAIAGSVVTSLQLEWKSVPEVSAGQPAEMCLLILNRGTQSVAGAQVEVVAPAGCRILGCAPEAVTLEPTMRWKLGMLEAGESRELRLRLVAEDASAVGLQAFVSVVAEAAAVVPVLRPGLAIAARCSSAGMAGGSVAVDVDVSNPGNGITQDIVVAATLPEGLSYREQADVQIPVGTLRPGESRRVRLNLDARRGGVHDVNVAAISGGGLREVADVSIEVIEPQVAMSIAGPAAINAGETCQLVLQVSNVGTVETSNLTARYHLPVGAVLVHGGRGQVVAEDGRMVQWFVGSLRPGERFEIPVQIRGTAPGSLVHEGAAIAEQGLPAVCRLKQEVAGVAKLEIVSRMVETGVAADAADGSGVSWQVRLRNSGTETATAIGVSCEIPGGLTLISADGPSQHLAENGVVIFRSLRELQPGEEVVFSFRAEQVRSGQQEVRTRLVADQLSEPLIERTQIERPSAAISE